ncbi:WRN exonuclease isoform X2 [Lycorma delicatula]|uniref:WRN exonuclease isoform X2 n=1 Tax=Lycorma delicatula TaxID=130591 RepID=UPI003F510E13
MFLNFPFRLFFFYLFIVFYSIEICVTDRPLSETDEVIFIKNVTGRNKFVSFPGKIHYYNNVIDIGLSCKHILENHLIFNHELPLGFDIEWPVDFTKLGLGFPVEKTALIQICPNETACYLFHVSELGELPDILFTLISLPDVKIVGLNIKKDVLKLGHDFNTFVQDIIEKNVVDVGVYANRVLDYPRRWSLQRLVLHCFGKDLDKDAGIRLGDWKEEVLTHKQMLYAATDAFVSLMLYKHLKHMEERRSAIFGLSF